VDGLPVNSSTATTGSKEVLQAFMSMCSCTSIPNAFVTGQKPPRVCAMLVGFHTYHTWQVSEPQPVPEHGVTVVFVELPNTKLELLHPLGNNSPIANFLSRNPAGGVHHVCLEVADVGSSLAALKGRMRVLNPEPKIGAHGNPVSIVSCGNDAIWTWCCCWWLSLWWWSPPWQQQSSRGHTKPQHALGPPAFP
jgi:methylmalonyl-CoA epimerase